MGEIVEAIALSLTVDFLSKVLILSTRRCNDSVSIYSLNSYRKYPCVEPSNA